MYECSPYLNTNYIDEVCSGSILAQWREFEASLTQTSQSTQTGGTPLNSLYLSYN
jgi:hypothetical protein